MWKTYPQEMWKDRLFQHKRAIPSYLSTSNVDKFVKKCAEMKKYTLNGERVILVSDTEVR